MKSRPEINMGHVGFKARSLGQFLKNVYTLKDI